MTESQQQKLELSAQRFALIEPYLKNWIKFDALVSLEKNTASNDRDLNSVLLLLDRISGIDYIALRDNSLFGISSRICSGTYNTFTVRCNCCNGSKTEYDKKAHINKGAIYPLYTVQAYFHNDKLYSIGLCYTEDLFEYINLFKDNSSRVEKKRVFDSMSGAQGEFYSVSWNEFFRYQGEKRYKTQVFEIDN